MITPEIARQALNEMTDMIADDNYFTVDAELTVWEEQTELIDSQSKYIGFLQSAVRSGEKWEGTIDDFISLSGGRETP